MCKSIKGERNTTFNKKCDSSFRNVPYPRAMSLHSSLISAAVMAATVTFAGAAETTITFKNTATDLSVAANYSAAPTSSTDVELTGSYTAGTTFNINGAGLSYGTLDDLDTSQSLTISSLTTASGSILLNSTGNIVPGAATGDLLYVVASANLTIQNGAGTSSLLIGNSGNFDNAGTLSLLSPITLGTTPTNRTLTFDGAGTTTVIGAIGQSSTAAKIVVAAGTTIFNGTNTYGGLTSLTGGTLTATNLQAFGTGTGAGLTISGGILNLLNDGGTGTVTGQLITYQGSSGPYTAAFASGSGTINVGNNGNAGSTGNTVQLGTLATNQNETFTNTANYSLAFGSVTSTSNATFTNNMLNGTLTLSSFTDTSGSTGTLTFAGTSSSAITKVTGIIQGTKAVNLVQSGAGTTILSGANLNTGTTTISSGLLLANTTGTGNSATGSGSVTVNGGALAGGGGTLATAGQIAGTVAISGGKISAGSGTSTAVGNTIGVLNTGVETWNSGTLVAKFASSSATTVSATDELVMSGLTIASASSFYVALNELAGNTSVTLSAGIPLVLVDDTNKASPGANPFSAAVLAALNLNFSYTGIAAVSGTTLQLDTATDGGSGYVLEVDAAPEPTSALLLGLAALPMLAERRRRRILTVANV